MGGRRQPGQAGSEGQKEVADPTLRELLEEKFGPRYHLMLAFYDSPVNQFLRSFKVIREAKEVVSYEQVLDIPVTPEVDEAFRKHFQMKGGESDVDSAAIE